MKCAFCRDEYNKGLLAAADYCLYSARERNAVRVKWLRGRSIDPLVVLVEIKLANRLAVELREMARTHVASAAMKRDNETMIRLGDCRGIVDAVNEACTCGGGKPGECCPACEVYHAIKNMQVQP